MNNRRALSLSSLLVFALATTACSSADEPAIGPVEDFAGGKGDGYAFTRELDPIVTALHADAAEGSYDPGRYVAYSFEVDRPMTIRGYLSMGAWEAAVNAGRIAVGLQPAYASTLVLFRRDESAPEDDPEALWDLEVFGSGSGFLQYDVREPGTFMIIALATPAAYEEQAGYSFEVRSEADLDSSEPGRVRATLVTDDRRPVQDLRVALGTRAARTDLDGVVVLDDVFAGRHIVKLGPNGTYRARPLEIDVFGGDFLQHEVLVLSAADYDEIKRQAGQD